MRRSLPLSLIAGVIALGLSAASGQAAITAGAGNHVAQAAHASSIVSKAGVRLHRRCWWHHHRRHCRYWR
jgi:hypothetical protein